MSGVPTGNTGAGVPDVDGSVTPVPACGARDDTGSAPMHGVPAAA
ncbi:hypothetical protein [Streptomyces sp. NPDC056405]